MASKKSKKKVEPREQTRIPNTGRIDAIEAIEEAAREYQKRVAAREQAEVAEEEANEALTQALIEHKRTEYQYEGKDGIPYIAYVPKVRQPKARIRKVKREKPKKAE